MVLPLTLNSTPGIFWPRWIITLGRVISLEVPKGMKGTLDARCNDQNIDSISFSSPSGQVTRCSQKKKDLLFSMKGNENQ